VSDVTGLPASDWATIGMFLVAIILILRSVAITGPDAPRWHPFPAIAGLAILAALVGFSLLKPELPTRAFGGPIPAAITVALVVVAFALVDFLFIRVVPVIRVVLRRVRVPSRAVFHVALALALIPVVAASTLAASRIGYLAPPTLGSLVGSVEEFDLPGDPLGIAMADARSGYVTLGQGSIVRFQLPTGSGTLTTTKVADGLEFPRGIAIAGNRLYVSELGSLPCRPAYPTCFGEQVAGTSTDGERVIIKAARGRITSFGIQAAALGDRRVLLGDLPVVDSLHAVNGLAFGPDGRLYVAIGAVDALWNEPTIEQGSTPHPEYMGTVLRVDPTSGAAEVFARGLRNVFGLTFGDGGLLWGVDNSGRAHNDRRAEEVLQIKQGKNYGYPLDGTFGPWSQRDDHPVWTIDDVGSAGIRWAGDAGMRPGLFLGSCGHLRYLRLTNNAGRWSVQNPGVDGVQGADLVAVTGCVTDVAAIGPRVILASVFNYGAGGKLLRITLSGNGE
jgi:hypothetical protein